ncbi:Hypothetical predicted protein [Cloeon dipterum]|uniref:Uncharacterized protein n=1 Tax=Cloeon dipterum TaxID=197152 RepID=A0A8S1CW38_9INSE|nr:Hypothetical predicted protein [Cloeon dipterum]
MPDKKRQQRQRSSCTKAAAAVLLRVRGDRKERCNARAAIFTRPPRTPRRDEGAERATPARRTLCNIYRAFLKRHQEITSSLHACAMWGKS